VKRIYIVFIGILVVVQIISYSIFIEPNMLTVKKSNIVNTKDSSVTLKVLQFTDTHLGEYYSISDLEKAVKNINDQNADIVVFTGDLIDCASNYNDINKISSVLKKTKANLGKYAIYGNHDYGGGAVRYYKEIMKSSGFKVLVNDSRSIKLNNNKSITIFGSDDGLMGDINSSKTMKNVQKNNFNLLLLHEPDYVSKFIDYPIDLVISGHSHGGQVSIPFYGALKKNFGAKKYSKGFYDLINNRDAQLYVSSGLGNTKMPFRFGNVPEIVVFNIKI
jgi:predicted MPP superfamily phosphohydrolase